MFQAGALIESFISDGVEDFLITDTTQKFYSRVGVISMADTPTVNFFFYQEALNRLVSLKYSKMHVSGSLQPQHDQGGHDTG